MNLTVNNVSAILLIASFVLHLIGVLMWNFRVMVKWFADTPTYRKWERGTIIAGYATAALGISELELILRDASEPMWIHLAVTSFLMAAVVAILTEGLALGGASSTNTLFAIMVVMLFVAEAIIGGALLASGLFPSWVDWALVIWNIGWLIVVSIFTPRDIYYPVLHFFPILLIGIMLLAIG